MGVLFQESVALAIKASSFSSSSFAAMCSPWAGEFNNGLRLAAADQKDMDATVQDTGGRDLSVQLKVAAYLFRIHALSCEVRCDAHNGFFGAAGVFAGAGFLFRRRRSIAARLGSNQGGRLNISPDLSSGTSIAKPGPSVAMAKFTPHGPRK